jgi:hypothetical protein
LTGVDEYRVEVVASYGQDVELFQALGRTNREAPGLPDLETSAEDWTVTEDVRIPPLRQTLTATYVIEARDIDEARQFALAIFARESKAASLPEPETVVANA